MPIRITGNRKEIIVSATLGGAGWSPILSLVSDGNRRVFQVNAWTGGSGTPPMTGSYIGATGLVVNIADAIDVRGVQGVNGLSTYQIAVNNGFIGTESEWLASLEGYLHTQSSPSTTWTINHNLGFFPQTQTFNTGGIEIKGEVLNISINQTIVTFIIPLAGYARIN